MHLVADLVTGGYAYDGARSGFFQKAVTKEEP